MNKEEKAYLVLTAGVNFHSLYWEKDDAEACAKALKVAEWPEVEIKEVPINNDFNVPVEDPPSVNRLRPIGEVQFVHDMFAAMARGEVPLPTGFDKGSVNLIAHVLCWCMNHGRKFPGMIANLIKHYEGIGLSLRHFKDIEKDNENRRN